MNRGSRICVFITRTQLPNNNNNSVFYISKSTILIHTYNTTLIIEETKIIGLIIDMLGYFSGY